MTSWEGNVCWRGAAGLIQPNWRPGSTEALVRLLPEGIGVMPVHLDLRQGTREEFERSIPDYERQVDLLAGLGAQVIHPAGPAFFLCGWRREQELVAEWQKKYGRPVFTSGMSQVNAMRSLGIRRFVGVSYFQGGMNGAFAAYFEDAGIQVLDMVGMDVAYDQVQAVASREVYRWAKDIHFRHDRAEGFYLQGPGWLTLDILETMESDFGVPVIHPIPAQSWEIQRRLRVREPRAGFGRLLRDMPRLPPHAVPKP